MLKGEAVVLIMDGEPDSQGESVDLATVAFPAEVSVRVNYDVNQSPVGKAKLRLTGDKLVAEFLLLDGVRDIPQRFLAVGGRFNSTRIVEGRGTKVTVDTKIDCLGLVDKNTDSRIQPIKFKR